MDRIEIMRDGKRVASSRNLRGIHDYARRSVVEYASLHKTAYGATLYVQFNDLSYCRTDFADFTIALRWVRARRSWELTETRNSDDYYAWHLPSHMQMKREAKS